MSKISKACDISRSVRQEVVDRDNGTCIVCGAKQNIQIAHFISRGRLGLGIPQNLACMCLRCHFDYDNGHLHNEIEIIFEGHLKANYPNWEKENLIYKKWRF